jgi:dipeptidyl aminopeptidase/acylaminoacyl peptidase
MKEMEVVSSLDGSREKCLLYAPKTSGKIPLLVGLHTWSYDRFNQVADMKPRCEARGWALLLPEFRGPNLVSNPRARQACASKLAKQDIIDAVDVVRKTHPIDEENVFLLGGSGGGHMSLMMAAYSPKLWKGVSSWVPITDLAPWHAENSGYAPGIAACCGGRPGTSPETDREYRDRSPLFQTESLLAANLCVHHGRFDRSVPYTHTWRLAQEMERLGAKHFFSEIFDGEHELRYDRAFQWFDSILARDRKGKGLTG